MQAFTDANIQVYTLSYDEPDALRDFRDAHNITYTLLSDPDSEVIKSFGILNTLVNEDDHPWYGIPYPGTYVVSSEGEITHKFFDSNLAVRAGPEQLLRAALGANVELEQTTQVPNEEVTVQVMVEGDSLTRTVQRDLVARFTVPSGKHVYATPAPEGTIAVDIKLDAHDGLVSRAIVRPQGEPHKLVGTDEVFDVHHGTFELRLPLTVNSFAGGELNVSGEVVWQSCDDEICDIPAKQKFEMTLPILESPAVALGSKTGAALEPNAMAHFVKMTERRKP